MSRSRLDCSRTGITGPPETRDDLALSIATILGRLMLCIRFGDARCGQDSLTHRRVHLPLTRDPSLLTHAIISVSLVLYRWMVGDGLGAPVSTRIPESSHLMLDHLSYVTNDLLPRKSFKIARHQAPLHDQLQNRSGRVESGWTIRATVPSNTTRLSPSV